MYLNGKEVDPRTLGTCPWEPWRATMEEKREIYTWWRSLTYEQQQEEWKRFIEENKKRNEKEAEAKRKTKEERDRKNDEWLYVNAEKPNSLDGGEALVTWLVVMGVGTIFNARWFIWIVATVIYLCYLNRHAIRKWKWDNGGKEQHYKNIEDALKGGKKKW